MEGGHARQFMNCSASISGLMRIFQTTHAHQLEDRSASIRRVCPHEWRVVLRMNKKKMSGGEGFPRRTSGNPSPRRTASDGLPTLFHQATKTAVRVACCTGAPSFSDPVETVKVTSVPPGTSASTAGHARRMVVGSISSGVTVAELVTPSSSQLNTTETTLLRLRPLRRIALPEAILPTAASVEHE